MYQNAEDGRIPSSAFQLGWDNFNNELRSLRASFRFDDFGLVAGRQAAPLALPRELQSSLQATEKHGFAAVVGGSSVRAGWPTHHP
jgi:hypothetical protein